MNPSSECSTLSVGNMSMFQNKYSLETTNMFFIDQAFGLHLSSTPWLTEVSHVLNHQVGPFLQKIFFKTEIFLVIATVRTRPVLNRAWTGLSDN